MTDLRELKQNVLMTAKKAYDEKLMAGTSGNISAYFREKQWIVITPSSYDYSLMAEEDIVVIDLDGNLVEGRHKPSSEWKMHAESYRHLSHANAVVHTHSPYASSFAVNHQEIPVVLIEMIPFLKGKLEVSPYAQQGSAEVGLNAVPILERKNACLMNQSRCRGYRRNITGSIYKQCLCGGCCKDLSSCTLFRTSGCDQRIRGGLI